MQVSDDTDYKQALLQKLSSIYRDQRRVGSLGLELRDQYRVECDLLFEQAWQGESGIQTFNPR